MKFRPHCIALAIASISVSAAAQQATPKLDRVEITGSLIKRTDRETPSLVQTITAEDIRNSGYATVEELLRATSAVDSSSVQDGAASGFVAGLSTISLRGFGSQGTLVLINGRRIAPVAAVDINFGRGSLLNVNTIPKAAIERIEILKDGASAQYGSDAMAGVVNYILKKEYQGVELSGSASANDMGQGVTKNANLTFGFGDLASQRYNIYGGFEVSRRDPVMHSQLKDRGSLAAGNLYNVLNGTLERFTPDSSASPNANYYRLPTSLAGSTTIDGRTVANTNLSGANYLGTFAGCPEALTVGQGAPNRPAGFASTTASLRNGFCRFNFDNADQAISEQERTSGSLRANFALSKDLTAYADLMVSRTVTTELGIPRALTTSLVTTGNRTATTWPKLDGSFLVQNALILPVGHPDNPTNGTASAQPVQLIYRFTDLPQLDTNNLNTARFVAGITGAWGSWDIDSAFLYSRQNNSRVQTNRLRKSLLDSSLAAGAYRFGKVNTPYALASVESDAVNDGSSTVMSLDARGSRELFSLPGGNAALAIGGEVRRESLSSVPSDIYKSGDFIGLVANGAEGSRNSQALFAEISLPVFKPLELQGAVRQENYSDFGNSTTGKLGFKFNAVPSVLAFRGTTTTGFRAPAISQIGNSFALSFHNFQERRVVDSLRCSATGFVSKTDPVVNRDCNVLGYSAVPAGTVNPGSIPSVISANPNLEPETSKSFTLGLVMAPTKDIDLALDAWFFRRNGEIRVQRGVDILEAYNANPTANADKVIRDPNPQSWLPGVPNSGPILAIVRGYGNYNWTETAGLDYDVNIRFPTTHVGKFSLNINGTVTKLYAVKILSGSDPQDLLGTTSADIPVNKASATLRWKQSNWNAWLRYNRIDALERASTPNCLTSTTVPNTYLQDNASCYVGGERSFDIGGSYQGFKNLSIAFSLLNLTSNYTRSIDVPNTFNFWDQGTASQLGRRFNLNATYQF